MGVGCLCYALYDAEDGILTWVLPSDLCFEVFLQGYHLGDVRFSSFRLIPWDEELFVLYDAVNEDGDLLHEHRVGYFNSHSAVFVGAFP